MVYWGSVSGHLPVVKISPLKMFSMRFFFFQNGYVKLIAWICRNIPSGLGFPSLVKY